MHRHHRYYGFHDDYRHGPHCFDLPRGRPPVRRLRGRRRMMRGFFTENPECNDKMVRYGVARMRDEDFTDDEIRAYLEDLHDCGHLGDIDIDGILDY